MPPLLTICPSRGRPRELARMLESFFDTSTQSELVVCLDEDDPELSEYDFKDYPVTLIIQPRHNITYLYNNIFQLYPKYEYYSCTNDDFVYKTKDWDKKLMNFGINFGNDLFQGNNYPSTSVIHGDIVRSLGWLQLPSLFHLCGDLVWNIIGINCGCRNYFKDVIIEHITPYNQKCEPDETFKHTNSADMYKRDQQAYIKWLTTQADKDVNKVKELMLCNQI